ncbi:hypothetical protein [Parasitella parasitica]|uniref:Nucleoporin Nup159/Nup146 N-terminal domain-containing protein n=1 Tax=Parasitella parasitica TaxID=35722 RepID=A0A0B7NTY6_9FUNG|nr:hypothetical protein [Parasitella parasitica]
MSSSFELDEIIEPTDVQFFKFSGLVPNVTVSTQEEPFDISKYPASVSLLACSSFIFASTKTLRTAILATEKGETTPLPNETVFVPLAKAIRHVRFSADEKHILIALEGGSVSVYNTDDIQNQKGNVNPINSFELGNEITDLKPNPCAHGNIAAVLYKNQQCALIDFTTGTTKCTFPLDNITAICWSFRGKQIVCGKSDGGLELFDIQGAMKGSLSIPEAMSAGHGTEAENRYVCDVMWIDNNIFLALYARKRNTDDDDYINDGYIINRKPAAGSEPVYTRLAEITPIFSVEGRGNHFYVEIIRGLGKEIKHLIIIANAATNEISVVGQSENDEWATWGLPENGQASLHLSEKTLLDTYPVGLAIDYTADEKLPPFDSSEKDVPVEPMPVFYYLNNEGEIAAYSCYNIELAKRGGSFKDEDTAATTTTVTSTANSATSPPSSGFSAFGAAAASAGGSFVDLLSGKSVSPAVSSPGATSGFGSFGSFGSAAAVPSFSNLGSAPKISGGFGSSSAFNNAAPSFGSPTGFGSATNNNSTLQFGSTSSFGAANQSSLPAFGSTSSFSVNANKTSASSFGSSSSSNSAKNTISPLIETTTTVAKETTPEKPTTTSIPPEPSVSLLDLGSLSTSSEDKKPETSNAETKPTAFGFTSTVGGGGFGSLAKNTVPGAKSPSTTIPSVSAFGTATTTPGATSLFGSASTTKASNTPTPTTITPNITSTFGTTSSIGTGSFGSLSSKTSPGIKSPASVKTTTTTTSTSASAATINPSAPTFKAPITTTRPANPVVSPSSAKDNAAESTAEKLKPTAEEGMAKGYEELYITVTDEIDQLKAFHNKLTLTMKAHTMSLEAKSASDLKDKDILWNLNETARLGNIADELVSSIKSEESSSQQIKQQVSILLQNCKKSMDKKEDVKYLLSKNIDSKVVDILDNRELDVETKKSLLELRSKSEACDNVIEDLEFKMEENKKINKIRDAHNAGSLSMYTLHRTIRDIEREITHTENSLTEYDQKIASIKLNNSRIKARRGASGISWSDLSDSEQDEDEERSLTPAVIEQTTRYLRRYQFLDAISNEISKSGPIHTSIE